MTEALIAIGAIIAAVVAAWFGGRRSAKTAQKLDTLEQEDAAHGRINEADLGTGADDGANAQWMRDFAAKHGKR